MKRHSTGNILLRLDEGDALADCNIFREEDDGILNDNAKDDSKNLTVDIPFDMENQNAPDLENQQEQ